MATEMLYNKRRAALFALTIYNAACEAFPGGQDAVADATQAALTTKAGLVALVAGRGVKTEDKSRMDRASYQLLDLLDVLGISDANVAADNTKSAFRTRLQAFANSSVGVLHNDGNLHWV